MTGSVTHIFRHPVKSHGREALEAVTLEPGRTMPWDRVWAVMHEASKANAEVPEWAPCQNFVLGAKAPGLVAVAARVDEAAGTVTLTHPDRPALTVNPDLPGDAARLVSWSDPLVPQGRARPARVIRVPGRGMTDTDYPSVSIGNLASLRALGQVLGRDLSPLRFRLNIWLDGLAPWEEFGWIGQEITLGPLRLAVRERVRRCAATSSNPDTGRIDADVPGAIEARWGHRDFGIYAEVTQGGTLRLGDGLSP